MFDLIGVAACFLCLIIIILSVPLWSVLITWTWKKQEDFINNVMKDKDKHGLDR